MCIGITVVPAKAQDVKIFLRSQPFLSIAAPDREVKYVEVIVKKGEQEVSGALVQATKDASLPVKVTTPGEKLVTGANGIATFALQNPGGKGEGDVTFSVIEIGETKQTPAPTVALRVQLLSDPPPLSAVNAISAFITFLAIMILLSAGVEKFTELIKIFLLLVPRVAPPRPVASELLGTTVATTVTKAPDWTTLQTPQIQRLYAMMVSPSELPATDEERLVKILEADAMRQKVKDQWTGTWRVVSLVVALIIVCLAGTHLNAVVLLAPVLNTLNIPRPEANVFGAMLTAFGAAAGSQFWHDILDNMLKLKEKVAKTP